MIRQDEQEPWVDVNSVARAEVNNELTLQPPRLGRLLRNLGRAFTLRCPHCGGRPVLQNWFRVRERCGACGEDLQRGEHDYFLGGMLFNLILAELLFVGAFMTFMIARWPDVPWDAIQVVAPVGMLVTPVILFPVSRLLWLAIDVTVRPSRPAGADRAAGGPPRVTSVP